MSQNTAQSQIAISGVQDAANEVAFLAEQTARIAMLSSRLTAVVGSRCPSSLVNLNLRDLRDHDPEFDGLLTKKITANAQKAVINRMFAIWQEDRDSNGSRLEEAKTDLTTLQNDADSVSSAAQDAVKRLKEVTKMMVASLPVTVADASRRRQEAIEEYRQDIRFALEFMSDRQDNERDKGKIQDRIRAIRTDPTYDPLAPDSTLETLQTRLKHLQSDHRSAVAQLDDHFKTGLSGSSPASRDSITLNIPRDIMPGNKNKVVTQTLTRFFHARIHDLFLCLLCLRRIDRDRDTLQGGRMWMPSMLDVDSRLHDAWRTQSKLLYSHLMIAAPAPLKSRLAATFSYGMNPTTTVIGGVKKDNGITFMYSMLALNLDDDEVIRREIRAELLQHVERYKRGNPAMHTASMRPLVNRGLEAQLRMQWHEVGQPIITMLSSRSTNFATRLIPFLKDGQKHSAWPDLNDALGLVDQMLDCIDMK